MKRFTSIIFVLSIFLALGSFTVYAEEEERPTFSADADMFTKYIWRGWEMSDDSLVFQPSMTALNFSGIDLSYAKSATCHQSLF